jgi:branched-subunit amino acid transport protein
MRVDVLLLLLGMMAVTYVPRMLPFLVLNVDRLPRGVRKTFALIPVTALGALVIPGVFDATSSFIIPGLAGMAAGAAAAWWKGGIVLPVIAAVGTTYLLMLAGL